jgi:hypothetical protein
MVWAKVVVKGALVIVTTEWSTAKKYNGTNLSGSTLKLEIPT